MAYASFTNVRKAIRERTEGTLTSLRAISAGRFDGEYYQNMEDSERRLLSLITPRYDVRITNIKRHESSTLTVGGIGLLEVSFAIICSYSLATPAETDDTRDVVRALAEQDADALKQALGWPESIKQTSASAATGLVGGRLVWEETEFTREEWGEGTDGKAGVLEATHRFTGTISVSQAVS